MTENKEQEKQQEQTVNQNQAHTQSQKTDPDAAVVASQLARAAVRQAQLIVSALNQSKENDGVWLNKSGMMAPRIYPKGPTVSPFNALILQLNADERKYSSSQYVFFHTAKAANIPVLGKEKGVPFNWYAWDNYVNRHDPKDVIPVTEYKKLSAEHQKQYKGVQQRQIRVLFNVAQTTLPHADADKYRDILDRFGTSNERGNLKAEERLLRSTVNEFTRAMKANLVAIRREVSDYAYFDTDKDAIYMPDQKKFETYPDYVQELMRQVVTATGHQQRLAREGMVMKSGHSTGEGADRYEKLVVELASAVKMGELGLPAKISPNNAGLIDKWTKDIQEMPTILDALEADVNTALDVIQKAERGEKVEYARFRTREQIAELQEKQRPQVDSRDAVIISDILRYGSMKVDERNFSSKAERDAFMEKYSLTHYVSEMEGFLELVPEEKDPENVELLYGEALKNAASINRICFEFLPMDRWGGDKSHYVIQEQLRYVPNEHDKSMVVVKDPKTGIYDVVLPGGAMSGGKVRLPDGEGKLYRITPDEVMSKEERAEKKVTLETFQLKGFPHSRIEAALKKDGARYVRFFNASGKLGYNADDAFYDGKTVHEMVYKSGKLTERAVHDVSEAVKAANTTLYDKVQMLKDDDGRWAFYIKPENEKGFCIYPDKGDTNRFFSTLRQGQQQESDRLRAELGRKYHEMVKVNPSLSFNIFNQVPEGVDVSRISRVNIYKTKEDKILCSPKIEGIENVRPREITRDQWNRMFIADDMAEYKTSLAAKIFADVLGVKAQQSQKMEEPIVQTESQESAKRAPVTIVFAKEDVENVNAETEEVVARSTVRR